MALFNNPTHQDVWVESHCGRCYFGRQPEPCTILTKALTSGRKPVEWERNTRKGALMAETMKCHNETRRARPAALPPLDLDVPMFDVVDSTSAVMDGDHA